jgi:hypothetical protein
MQQMSTFEKEKDTKKNPVSTFIKLKQKNIFSVSTLLDKYSLHVYIISVRCCSVNSLGAARVCHLVS